MSRYAILGGGGRQGTATAYYLARYFEARTIILIDVTEHSDSPPIYRAQNAVSKLNVLLGEKSKTDISSFDLDSNNLYENGDLISTLKNSSDVLISALPSKMNMAGTFLAANAGVHYIDFGFDEKTVRKQIKTFDQRFKINGKAAIVNSGLEPGIINTIAVHEALLTKANTVKIYVGGNPCRPQNLFGYEKVFSGSMHEYSGSVGALENGEVVAKNSLDGLEAVSVYPASSGGGARYDFEAFYANTGFALTAEILKENGTINAYAKTLRKVGHYKFARSMQELGLFSENPIKINGMAIRPIDFVSELFDTNTSECQDDMVAAKIVLENGLLYSITLINYKNVVSGFSAMQIVTAKPVAAMANMLARGWIPPGCDL